MPVTKPGTLPRWSETAGGTQSNITPAPSSGRLDIGWLPDDESLAQWDNWWKNLGYRWMAYLNDLENQALTWVGVQTFSARAVFSDGILVNAPSTSNRPGIDSTGNGTGAGVKGTATNNASSSGIHGIGNGSGPGVRGVSANASIAALFSSDAGVEAVKIDASAGTGTCVLFAPNSTRAPMNLGALTADPSTLVDGDFWYNTTADKFRGRANGVTVDFH